MSGKWDTPTDGISRKVFDRYKDTQVRKYVELSQEVRRLRLMIKQLIFDLQVETKEERDSSAEGAPLGLPAEHLSEAVQSHNYEHGSAPGPSSGDSILSEEDL